VVEQQHDSNKVEETNFEILGAHVAIGSLWKARRKIYVGPVYQDIVKDEWVTVISLIPSQFQGRFERNTAHYWDVELLGLTRITKMLMVSWATWSSYFWTQEELDCGEDKK